MAKQKPTRVMAISSGGGHWVELVRLKRAFEGCETHYVTVDRAYGEDIPGERLHVVRDATRWSKVQLVLLAMEIAWLLMRVRPKAIVSTGAAPGYIAIKLGKLLRIRCVWIDSIANAEELSMCGRLAGSTADLWLTQWPHLAKDGGPAYRGAVL